MDKAVVYNGRHYCTPQQETSLDSLNSSFSCEKVLPQQHHLPTIFGAMCSLFTFTFLDLIAFIVSHTFPPRQSKSFQVVEDAVMT